MTRRFAWVDLETTGLEPKKGYILEAAFVITDDKLKRIAQYQLLIEPPLLVRLFPHMYMDDFVFDMHTKNGLLKACKGGYSIKEAQRLLVMGIRPFRNNPETGDELYLVGNSIGSLDMPFLKEHMPELMDLVHYRSIDISGTRLALEQIFECPNGFYFKSQEKSNHRALDDINRSIEQLRFYKNKIREFFNYDFKD